MQNNMRSNRIRPVPRIRTGRGSQVGRFTDGPFDPPAAFKSGWKEIRLEIGVGSTDISLSTETIKTSLTTLGIAANSIRLLKVAAWILPGVAANQTAPRVVVSMRDPVSGGSLGTREDTGLLSRAAHVHYSFADAVREHSIDLPGSPQDAIVFAKIASSQALGSIQVSLAYNI